MKFLTLDGLAYFYTKCKSAFVHQEAGKGLSTNDFSNTEKTKLSGIAENANNYTLPTANSTTKGGVCIGSNITISDGAISISKNNVTAALGYTPPTENTDTNTTYTISKIGGTITLTGSDGSTTSVNDADTTYGVVNASLNGLMTPTMNTKLTGVATGAQVNVIETVKVDGVALPVSSKAVNIDLSTYAKKSDIASIYKPMGTVNTYADLPPTGSTGEVWNVKTADVAHDVKAGDNLARLTDGTWDNLSGIFDTSSLATKDELNTLSGSIVAITNAEIDSAMV